MPETIDIVLRTATVMATLVLAPGVPAATSRQRRGLDCGDRGQ